MRRDLTNTTGEVANSPLSRSAGICGKFVLVTQKVLVAQKMRKAKKAASAQAEGSILRITVGNPGLPESVVITSCPSAYTCNRCEPDVVVSV